MSLKGKRVAVLVETLYEDLEVWYPNLRLKEAGAEVTVVGTTGHMEYRGKYGYPIMSDIGVGSVKGGAFDAVVIPGGYAPDHMRRSPAMKRFVADAYRAGKILAAICHGPWMLASHPDSIRGRTVTGFMAIEDDLRNAGAEYVDREVVVDGPIITSRKPADLPAFMQALIAALGG